jgi:hypothetical protein
VSDHDPRETDLRVSRVAEKLADYMLNSAFMSAPKVSEASIDGAGVSSFMVRWPSGFAYKITVEAVGG